MIQEIESNEDNNAERLFEWAEGRPAWQQEVLRRLSVQDEFSGQDIEEITELCRLSKELAPKLPTTPKTQPLKAEHLGSREQPAERIFLRKLHGLKAVSALPVGASLEFVNQSTPAEACLSVVYGENASGKSSYARILKACGRSRAKVEPIPPDYRRGGDPTANPPEAEIDFSIANSNESARWVEGEETDSRLREIVFFDAECAEVQVAKPNTLSYLPGGLHLLRALGDVSTKVQEKLRAELTEVEQARPVSITSPAMAEGTEAYRALNNTKTKEDLEKLRDLAELSPAEERTLRELTVTFADEKRAKELAHDALIRVSELFSRLQELGDAASDEHAEAIKQLLAEYHSAAEALKSIASDQFSGTTLPGVGTTTWRALWEAAKHFSEKHAYPDKKFPVMEDGSHCVLCQQELLPDAQERFRAFAGFFEREADKALTTADRKLKEHESTLRGLDHDPSFILKEGLFSDLEQAAPDAIKPFKEYWKSGAERITLLLGSLESRQWQELPPLPVPPVIQVQEAAHWFGKKTSELNDDKTRDELKRQLTELQGKAALQTRLPDAAKDLRLRLKLEALRGCLSDAATDEISRQIKHLGKSFLTNKLQLDFQSELKKLGLSTVQVDVTAHGSYGALQFEICLVGASPGTKVLGILSEGEKRCVALAGFLAELRHDSTVSTLVFDDPVTSLDHYWRNAVGARLVQEALHHQVIVFTHDVVFLFHLQEHARKHGVPFYPTQIERLGATVGTYKKGKPWIARSVSERLKHLEETTLKQARQFHSEGLRSEYEEKVGYFYGRLRETWERAVEECLFCGSVARFQRNIHTQPLNRMREIRASDLGVIDEAMTHCSAYLTGHDAVPDENPPTPTPEDLERDLKKLRTWAEEFNARPELRKIKKSPDSEVAATGKTPA